MDLLKKFNVRLVFHITHPYEICDKVKDKIFQIQSAGIRMYNQFPILRNINDNFNVIKKLLFLLDSLSIRNLSIFIPDPIKFSASYRINIKRVFEIMNKINWETPSWINSTRLVLDSNIGKLRKEDFIGYDESKKFVIFGREGKIIKYPDFPIEYDIPGDINMLLWKD